MSKYTTIFILNLAFADFLYCSTSLPLYSLTVRFQVYPKYFSLHFSSFQEDGLGNLQRVALLQTLALLLLHFVISMLMLHGCLLGLLLSVGKKMTKKILTLISMEGCNQPPLSEYCAFSGTKHQIDLSPVVKCKFVH